MGSPVVFQNWWLIYKKNNNYIHIQIQCINVIILASFNTNNQHRYHWYVNQCAHHCNERAVCVNSNKISVTCYLHYFHKGKTQETFSSTTAEYLLLAEPRIVLFPLHTLRVQVQDVQCNQPFFFLIYSFFVQKNVSFIVQFFISCDLQRPETEDLTCSQDGYSVSN